MDLNMPVMDGLSATENILNLKRDMKLSYSLKIVAVSAFASEEQKSLCKNAGMSKFVSKPVAYTTLKQLIETHYEN